MATALDRFLSAPILNCVEMLIAQPRGHSGINIFRDLMDYLLTTHFVDFEWHNQRKFRAGNFQLASSRQ